MTNGASAPSDQERYTRVTREVDMLREQGYQADSKLSPPYHVVTVQTQRATDAGPQAVTIYFALDPNFPNSVPIMEIRLASSQFNPNGEVRDFMIDLDTKKRLEWNPTSQLYKVVDDIHSKVQDDKNLHIKNQSTWPIKSADFAEPDIQTPAQPPVVITEPLHQRQPPPTTAPNYRLPIVVGAIVLGLAVIALVIFLINRPPSVEQQVAQLWQEAASLEGAYTPESMEQRVGLLDKIRNLNPQATSPDSQTPVAELLIQARVRWGDLLYSRDPAAAAVQYQAARELDGTSKLVADRLAWIERDKLVRNASIVTWLEAIELLRKGAEQDPKQRDPNNKSIQEWLYQAHVAYGQALLANPDDLQHAKMALEQAKAAIALATEINNDGVAATELLRQAQNSMRANSKYDLEAETLAQENWDKLLAERNIRKPADRVVNLLVVASSQQTLTLIGPHAAGAPGGANKQLTTNSTGEATESLENGTYTVQVNDGDMSIQTQFTITAESPYVMVRVIERP